MACNICSGLLWVCEDHPTKPFDDSMDGGCECNAGMPCVCNPMGALPPGSTVLFERVVEENEKQ